MMSRAILGFPGASNIVRAASCLALLCIVAAASPAPAQTAFEPIRVDAGGSGYTDSLGQVWGADTGFGSGTVATSTSATITGTPDSALFQSIRYLNGGSGDLTYSFSVPNGAYEVKLLFAEIWSGAFTVGVRTFHIKLEGETVEQNLDVFAVAGANAALVRTFPANVTDGSLSIALGQSVQNPVISGIEIKKLGVPGPPESLFAAALSSSQVNLGWAPASDETGIERYEIERCEGTTCSSFARVATTVGTSYSDSGLTAGTSYRYRVRAIDTDDQAGVYSAIKNASTNQVGAYEALLRVNSGGASYVDSASNTWGADSGANVGMTTTVGNSISGTADPSLYQSLRWWEYTNPELEYTFAVANGIYQVKLHFAEIWSGAFAVGARVFDVQLEGVTVFNDLDVFAEAGANTALLKTTTTTVTDGQLNIRFPHGPIQHPFVSAIEVQAESTVDSTAPTAVTGLTATAASATRIDVAWTAATDAVGVVGYLVERCSGSACTDFMQIATTGTLTYTDLGLVPATTYRYRVRAADAASNLSVYSSIGSDTTQSGTATDTQPPTVPGALVVNATSGSDALLQWWASIDANGIDGYRVERCVGVSCTDFAQLATPVGALYVDTSTQPLLTYRYRVRAADSAGNLSGYSNIVNIAILADTIAPTTPGLLTIQVTEAHKLGLTWTASTDNIGVTAYLLERCPGTACTNFAQVANVSVPGYEDNGRPSNTAYRYRVRARDAANNLTAYSNIVAGTTLAGSGGAGTVTYTYDLLGRITGVVEADGSTIQYTYDANGNMTSTTRTAP
jgi:YD repeat-containing protein